MVGIHIPAHNTRLGFHYFSDQKHYRARDLQTWLPELHSLNASWLFLKAPRDLAIPERFLAGLVEAGVEPVLGFSLPLEPAVSPQQLAMLFSVYARWGVHYAVLFDRPNRRTAWSANAWAKDELVERFLDQYLPIASAAEEAGITSVFPPMEPGGDYWDTAFLRAALSSLQRRSPSGLENRLVISAYAQAGEKPLDWGLGGPENWPGAKPYHTPSDSQDQRGFRIFDWYLATAQAVLGFKPPILLFGVDAFHPCMDEVNQVQRAQRIAGLLTGNGQEASLKGEQPSPEEQLPAEVLAGFFSRLSCSPGDPCTPQTWFRPNGSHHPAVITLRRQSNGLEKHSFSHGNSQKHPIAHYLLLPAYSWGISDWHLTAVRPYLKKYRPTLGFSIEDALLAERVTVVGNEYDFPEDSLNALRAGGCLVDRIGGDGTSIATFLAE